jgi:hypothetical protein
MRNEDLKIGELYSLNPARCLCLKISYKERKQTNNYDNLIYIDNNPIVMLIDINYKPDECKLLICETCDIVYTHANNLLQLQSLKDSW